MASPKRPLMTQSVCAVLEPTLSTDSARVPFSFGESVVTKQEPEAGEPLPVGGEFVVWVKKRSK